MSSSLWSMSSSLWRTIIKLSVSYKSMCCSLIYWHYACDCLIIEMYQIIIEKPNQNAFIWVFALVFCSELNDTVVEAQQRIREVPPVLPVKNAIKHYLQSSNRLLILVYFVSPKTSIFASYCTYLLIFQNI